MARKFGGKYSPGGAQDAPAPRGAYDGAKVDPVGFRANAMFLPPIVLAALSINDGALGLTAGLVGAGILTLGAWLLRGGLQAQMAYDSRRVARRPAIPRKLLAAALAGLGIAAAAWRVEPGLIAPILFGLATAGLHFAAFGIDPFRDKGMEGIDTFQQDRVARVVDEAQAHLDAMSDAIKRSGDRALERRVEYFQTTVRDLIRTVEEDPRDLTAARKYLGVYLLGARDATVRFADVYARTRDAGARTRYAALLDDLDQNFAARTAKLLEGDNTDLNIEIDVLRGRLQREGVRLDPETDR
ncbi:MAG: 5-bromo-4-chloroindolyl phosphate hydrolysis family protein [Pseudomonadota bacterium]